MVNNEVIKRFRWRQHWYNVHCMCDVYQLKNAGKLFNDYTKQKEIFLDTQKDFPYAVRKNLIILALPCNRCGHYHWMYDTPYTDPVYNKSENKELRSPYLYQSKSKVAISKLENISSDLANIEVWSE